MTADHTPRGTVRTPVSVRPGAAVAIALLTFLLSAFILPAAVPDRPTAAYLSAGLIGAGVVFGVLLAADFARAAAARRAGAEVSGITVGAFGSRLTTVTQITEPVAAARVARAGLLVGGLGGGALVVLGWLAPGGAAALAGSVGLWAGGLLLLLTASELLPTPRTGGGRLLAAAVYRRTGSRERADAAVARAAVIVGWTLIASGLAVTFLTSPAGLWVALLGWIALGAGRLEQSRLRTNRLLAGVRVGEVMGPAPESVAGWRTVAAAVDEVVAPAVVASGRTVFTVVDFDGALAGVVFLRDLDAVPLDDRGLTRVSKVSVPMAGVCLTTPDELLTDLLPRLAGRPGAGLALAVDDIGGARPQPVGAVGHMEITKALAVASSRAAVAGAHGGAGGPGAGGPGTVGRVPGAARPVD
ncbi:MULTISPECIES: putative transmembrane alanine and leucine rich protein [Protofrankia]|uniref:Putative transmembrane alanine and leucine rich protein n=1 Tax=Candidatus Protofrankia datiscae TaxID=2716812 RepID=F8AYX3_9ACTN|nr:MULTISPECIES: putative transmembrane alanine and leucine rich protein [Protofrankia]AEH09561.1 putative transmembrane alanine and leucine rich protein [Candidatus Protofrankia datiscae]